MTVTPFEPSSQSIVVRARVLSATGEWHGLSFVLDTGASMTLLEPGVLDYLGYSVRQAEGPTVIRLAIGDEPGFTIRVAAFEALGHQFEDFRVHAHDPPEGYGIDRLLGLNFLRHFNYEVRSAEGKILVERIAAG